VATAGGSNIKLHFIRTPRERNSVLEELYALLIQRGFVVTEGIPDKAAQDLDMVPQHDLYILKARTELPVSLAGVLHQRGARLLNPYPSCMAVLNKIVATAAMRSAGIPTPRSWATADPSLLHSIATAERLSLIIKPFDGIHSQGILVVRDPDELEDVPASDKPMLVQQFIEGCTVRFKVHCVGDEVFATWKPFSLGGTRRPGQPCEVSDELRELALRCGKLFGMGLYGLDVLVTQHGPVVVDVNSFPGYGGVPGIAKVIADYIEGYAHGRIALPLAHVQIGESAKRCA
jgi:ribosomal protein S6--L-glutamate ligase